jgi:hypothetical protein
MAFPANAYIYEFLYRGRAVGDPTPADYHVIVAVPGTDAFGNPTASYSPPMTPDQATAQGLTLPDLIAGINTALTAEVTSLQAQLAAKQTPN